VSASAKGLALIHMMIKDLSYVVAISNNAKTSDMFSIGQIRLLMPRTNGSQGSPMDLLSSLCIQSRHYHTNVHSEEPVPVQIGQLPIAVFRLF
jgi:hypothetical protein